MVHKWNLVFDGSKDGLNVVRFLYRVESNASSYNIPEFRLLNDIQYLLKGKALNWYWAHKEAKRPNSWLNFRYAMVKHFQDARDDFDIRQSIKDRKQKINETFQDYYTAISEITLSLSQPLTDLEFLHYLHGNMRKGLKQKLAGRHFNSSTDLFDECVHIENAWRQISFVPEQLMDLVESHQKSAANIRSNQRPPYANNRDINKMSYENFSASSESYNQIPMVSSSQPADYLSQSAEVLAIAQNHQNSGKYNSSHTKQNPILFPQALFGKVKCWNCSAFGHFYYRCPQPLQHIFCRGCG